MKANLIGLLLMLCFVSSCRKNTHLQNSDATVSVPANVDQDFSVFLAYFSRDSAFQVSRVAFPMQVTEPDDDYNPIKKTINKETYRKIDLRYNNSLADRRYDKHTQKINLGKNKATIEVRGIDNGIMTDVFFEKRNGKWTLVGWDDAST